MKEGVKKAVERERIREKSVVVEKGLGDRGGPSECAEWERPSVYQSMVAPGPLLPPEDVELFFRTLDFPVVSGVGRGVVGHAAATATYSHHANAAAASARHPLSQWYNNANASHVTREHSTMFPSSQSLGMGGGMGPTAGSPPAYHPDSGAGAGAGAASSFLHPAATSPVYVPTTRAMLPPSLPPTPQYGVTNGSTAPPPQPGHTQTSATSMWPLQGSSDPSSATYTSPSASGRYAHFPSNPSPPGINSHMARTAGDSLSGVLGRGPGSGSLGAYGTCYMGTDPMSPWNSLNQSMLGSSQQPSAPSPLRRSALGQYVK